MPELIIAQGFPLGQLAEGGSKTYQEQKESSSNIVSDEITSGPAAMRSDIMPGVML